MVQIITAVEACTAARKAYNEGRLLAQCADGKIGSISYGYEVDIEGAKFVCGIGACLNQASLDLIAGNNLALSTIESDLALFNYIFDCSADDYPALNDLQRSHDFWLMSRIEGRDEIAVAASEMEFLATIQSVLGEDDA